MPSAVLFDTEFTTWEGAMASGWSEPWQHREIVQIAAMKIDADTLEEISRFEVLIKPVKNSTLSDYFVELTGITNDQVKEDGISFEKAHDMFLRFVDQDKAWSYGGDGSVFEENYNLYKQEHLKGLIDFQNTHDYFEGMGVDIKKVNSGRLAEHFGLNLKIHEHNAMDDVRSIHASLKHLKSQNKPSPF